MTCQCQRSVQVYLYRGLLNALGVATEQREVTVNARVSSKAALVFLLLVFTIPKVNAQSYLEGTEDRWRFLLAPYLWAVNINGDIAARGVEGDINLGFDELLDQVDIAAQVHFEAKKDKWAFILDSTYIEASDDNARVGPAPAETELEYLMTELLTAYRFSPKWEVIGGLRLWDMENIVTIGGGPRIKQSTDWVDLVGGARFTTRLMKKWFFIGRGDIGGFGISDSSDISLGASALFAWQFGKNDSLVLGYRILNVNREDGSGANKFEVDLTQDGPLVGVAFTWPRKK